MNQPEISPELLEILKNIQGKRSRVVVEHILKHGFITTEDLENIYGYSHPPRAIRDVREQGVPLESFRVKNEQGRSIAAYRFGDLSKIEAKKFGGRKIFSKEFKQKLVDKQGNRCAICNTLYESRYLQIDHRIPYELVGELKADEADYNLLCASCNRAKAWSCAACDNMKTIKNPELCEGCYWASPLAYEHIALQQIRRLELLFAEDEFSLFEHFNQKAKQAQIPLAEYIKRLLKKLSLD